MKSRVFSPRAGFTLLELFAVLATVAILIALLVPVVTRKIADANTAKCVGQLRQLGVASSAYAADNNNEWTFYNQYDWPANHQAWATPRIRNGAVWTALGKTYPYHQDKRLFFCPAGKTPNARNTLENGDWRINGFGSMNGSYLIRGYGQTNPRPLAKTYAGLGRIAIASCQFAYASNNPVNLPIGFHDGAYPVLFTDGSVQILRFPEESMDLRNPPEIWGNNVRQILIWQYFDGKTSTLNL